MAHFAELDDTNVVKQVIVVGNEQCLDADGNESETVGQAFIASIGLSGRWIQTSYNGNFRGKYAGIGDWFDETNDVFVTIPDGD